MELAFWHINQTTHIRSKFLFKRREVNVAIAICVQNILHQKANIALRRKYLILQEMRLEVLVGDEAITIGVKSSENFKGSWLARAKRCLFNLT